MPDQFFTATGKPPRYAIKPRRHFLQVTLEVELYEEFYFWTEYRGQKIQIAVPAGIYDGFSIPWLFRILSLGQLNPVMAGMPAAFVHDIACERQLFDRKWRRDVFMEAYDACMVQYHPEHNPEAWGSVIKRGVLLGSKLAARC